MPDPVVDVVLALAVQHALQHEQIEHAAWRAHSEHVACGGEPVPEILGAAEFREDHAVEA